MLRQKDKEMETQRRRLRTLQVFLHSCVLLRICVVLRV